MHPVFVDSLLIVFGLVRITDLFVESDQIAHGDRIPLVGSEGLEVGCFGMRVVTVFSIEGPEIRPRRGKAPVGLDDGVTKKSHRFDDVAVLHPFDPHIVIEIGDGSLVGDGVDVVGALEFADVEVDDVGSGRSQIDGDVDMPVKNEDILPHGPIGRDIHLLKIRLQPDTSGEGDEHGRERQAVSQLEPEGLRGVSGILVVLQPEGRLAHDRVDQLLQLENISGAGIHVVVEELPHLIAQGEDCPAFHRKARITGGAQKPTREQLSGRWSRLRRGGVHATDREDRGRRSSNDEPHEHLTPLSNGSGFHVHPA